MHKIAIGLSALLLIAAVSTPSAAQEVTVAEAAQRPAECAEYLGCLDYGTPSDALARTSRVERSRVAVAPQLTWRENPSLMDTSWRQWPSLTDF